MYIKHKFQTGKGDGPDSTRVRPTSWNDDHDFWIEEGMVVGRPPGAGDGPAVAIPVGNLIYPGVVTAFAGLVAPPTWHICDGGSLVRADNLGLYNAIGLAYGEGNVPGTTFAKPDLRGRVIAMIDATGGRLTNATMVPNGNTLGAVGGQQTEQAYADITVNGARSYGQTYGGGLSVHVEMDTWDANGSLGTAGGGPATGTHSHHMSGDFGVGGTSGVYVDVPNLGGGGYTRAVTNMPPALLMNYIIKG